MIEQQPYYLPQGREVELFESAYRNQIPVLLKGPDRLRQDALHALHGLEARTAAHHRLLP